MVVQGAWLCFPLTQGNGQWSQVAWSQGQGYVSTVPVSLYSCRSFLEDNVVEGGNPWQRLSRQQLLTIFVTVLSSDHVSSIHNGIAGVMQFRSLSTVELYGCWLRLQYEMYMQLFVWLDGTGCKFLIENMSVKTRKLPWANKQQMT